MSDYFQYFLTSFIFTFFAIPVFIRILEKYQILESPGKRKIHKTHTASLGGIPVFLAVLATIIIWWPANMVDEFKMLLAATILMFLIGLKDDLIPLKATHKLISQLLPVSLIAISGLALIPSFYGLFGDYQLGFVLSLLITIYTFVVIINSINLIDGVDGLAAGLGLVILTFFAVWFYLVGNVYLSTIATTFVGGFLAFLFFNWQPSKIFMGDTGALILGFTIAFLTISFLNVNHSLPQASDFKFRPGIASSFCVLFVPLFDTLRVFIIRISAGVSPFRPDKNHVHHILLSLGLSHSQTSLILIFTNVMFICLAIGLRHLTDVVFIPILILLSIVLSYLMRFLLFRKGIVSRVKKYNKVISE